MKIDCLGEVETLVLLAVARGHGEAYAPSIRREIRDRAGRELARGTVYVTLKRLTEKGLAESWQGDPTPRRGGRATTHYRVTAAGRELLRETLAALRGLAEGLDLAEAP